MKERIAYRPRHAPRVKPFQPPQLQRVLDETAAFSLLVAETKRGNGTACYLLGELFGESALGKPGRGLMATWEYVVSANGKEKVVTLDAQRAQRVLARCVAKEWTHVSLIRRARYYAKRVAS